MVFLKLGEIDTMKENFAADAFVQAKWREPLFDGHLEIVSLRLFPLNVVCGRVSYMAALSRDELPICESNVVVYHVICYVISLSSRPMTLIGRNTGIQSSM